jgi:hypothetical protein
MIPLLTGLMVWRRGCEGLRLGSRPWSFRSLVSGGPFCTLVLLGNIKCRVRLLNVRELFMLDVLTFNHLLMCLHSFCTFRNSALKISMRINFLNFWVELKHFTISQDNFEVTIFYTASNCKWKFHGNYQVFLKKLVRDTKFIFGQD